MEKHKVMCLDLVLMFVLQLEGVSGGETHLYHRAGDDVVLPCSGPDFYYPPSCFTVDWLHSRDEGSVSDLIIRKGIQRSSRVSVDDKCSLIINNITAEDAGQYACRHFRPRPISIMFLDILMISVPGADPMKDEVTLLCSLLTFEIDRPCPEDSLRWEDETGAVLTGFWFSGQTDCVSYLTLKRQTGQNRRVSCQFVEGNQVKTETHYTLVSTEESGEVLSSRSPLSSIMLTLRLTALILMIGLTVDIIRTRGRNKTLKDVSVHQAAADDTVNYENVGEDSAAST